VSDTLPLGSSAGLLESLAGFVKELRTAGIPVSLTENLDAVEALRHIPLEDREAFKYSLAATMVKNNAAASSAGLSTGNVMRTIVAHTPRPAM